MKLCIPFKDYLGFLRKYSNAPLTLNRLTLPFGVISNSDESATLLVGHILEDLATRIGADQPIDCIDVAASAYELGHEPAGPFLDEAPFIMCRLMREQGNSCMH